MALSLKERIAARNGSTQAPFEVEMGLQDRISAQASIVDPHIQQSNADVTKFKYGRGDMPEIDTAYSLYSDNAHRIGAKEFLTVDQFIDLDQTQSWLATIPVRRNFASKVVESYRRGGQHIDMHIAIAEAGTSEDIDRLVNMADKADRLEELDPIEDNMVSQFFYGLAGILPGIIRGAEEGLDEALVGAAGGATSVSIAHAIAPPTLIAAPITYPAATIGGGIIGMKFGATKFWYKEGQGSMILDMRRQGVDHKTAQVAAGIAAVPYAALELMQVGRIIPGKKQLIKKLLGPGVGKAMARATLKYGGTLTKEVRDEVIQEAIKFTAVDLGREFSEDTDITWDEEHFIQRSQELWETAKAAAVSMALLPLPVAAQAAMGPKGVQIKPEPTQTLTPKQQIESIHLLRDEIRTDTTLTEDAKDNIYVELDRKIAEFESQITPTPVAESRHDVSVPEHITTDGTRVESAGPVPPGEAAIMEEGRTPPPRHEDTITVEGQPLDIAHDKPSYDILKKAHIIKDKGDIPDDVYRALAKKITGKTSMTDMTYREGIAFLDALQDKYKVDMTYNPALDMGPVEPEFKEPTVGKLITPQDVTARNLGGGPAVEPAQKGKLDLQHEYLTLVNEMESVLGLLHKESQTTRKEKRRYHKKGEPTAAMRRMAEILNTHEKAPEFLTETETEVFNWFRKLSNNLFARENQVRRALKIKEIPFRKAYFRHVADQSAEAILNGQMDIPPEIEFWLKRRVGSKVYNTMEMQRDLASELEELYSRDLAGVTRGMTWTALKEIHLNEPLAYFKEWMKAHHKGMPASTRQWLEDYVNVVIMGQQSQLDATIERLFTQGPMGTALRVGLDPFGALLSTGKLVASPTLTAIAGKLSTGKVLSKRPVTNASRFFGRVQHVSGLAMRPKLWIRNLFQKGQDMAMWPIKHVVLGRFPASEAASKIINESKFFRGYTGVEDMPVGLISRFEKYGMMPYQLTAQSNAKGSMKVAFSATKELITDPKHKELGWADPKRDYSEPDDFFYPSELQRLKVEMELGAATTQYNYTGIALPELFRNKTLGSLTKFQSWWMNYFMRFQRETLIRTFTGRTSYGAKIPTSWRLGQARYAMTAVPLLATMGYSSSFLLGVLPTGLAPSASMLFGLYSYITAKTDRDRDKAEKEIVRGMPLMVPGGLGAKDAYSVWSGEKDIDQFLFYQGPEDNNPDDAWW